MKKRNILSSFLFPSTIRGTHFVVTVVSICFIHPNNLGASKDTNPWLPLDPTNHWHFNTHFK